MKHDMKLIFLVGKQASLYSNFGMSKRIEKLFFPLSPAPFYVHSLGSQRIKAWNVEGLVS